ncbi:hypothetical protein HYFRA_00013432 [Hymenoscyphus fraxineus]|uniref:Heterokaryon incompatibility domain-containing protein n=1 Tax=Hymenoscyphus fraxineus TaxID=746836 RepID=A0A9N9PND0_9HELO|nr:hypothetical protein HYFRA_00013432 [Hymenoscyphus fraxineus]
MEDYQYTPLSSPTSIRVLQLHIAKTENTSTTSFSLKEVDLQESPKYEALSYTWGQATSYDKSTETYQWAPTEKCPIQISNTGVVRITRNLCDLFKNLIEGAPLGQSVSSIWADQVCINQNDVQERNSQVAMMKDIYAQAWRTLIWLGKPDSDMLVVANLFEVITTIDYSSLQRTRGSSDEELQEDILKVIAIKSDSNWQDDLEFIGSIVNTLNKSWFSRAWIVQEVILSQEPLLLFGKKTYSIAVLNNLVTLTFFLERRGTNSFTELSEKAQLPGARGLLTLKSIMHCRQMMEHDVSKQGILKDVLNTLAFSLDASDPRDRIYAFLAFQESNENQIVPDYTLEINDAYTKISESIVKSTNSLSILGLVRGTSSPGSLPSWVVDWRVKEETQGNPFDD